MKSQEQENSLYNVNAVLQYAVDHDMIDVQYVQDQIEMLKKKELLKKHPYKIWQGKDGKWRTYLPDEEKGRNMKKRNTEAEIEDIVAEYWKEKIENPTVRELYDEWVTDKLKRREILKEIRKRNPFGEYLFEKNGERIRTYTFTSRLKTICRKLGIVKKSLNKIRKTYGTILLDNGVEESLVIAQMGHTDIKTTKRYYYRNRKSLQQKSEVIDKVSGL